MIKIVLSEYEENIKQMDGRFPIYNMHHAGISMEDVSTKVIQIYPDKEFKFRTTKKKEKK